MVNRQVLSLILLVALVTMGISQPLSAQEMKVATFNIRQANKGDIGNLWNDRAPIVASLIRYHEFDVFGTQEGFLSQLQDLEKALPEYGRYGVGRDDGKEAGEHSAVYYKKDRFVLLDKGDFWLAENPDVPGKGWDATCCNRIVSWVKLKDKQVGKTFFFFSAHYDHQGQIARRESSKLMLAKIKEIAGDFPVVFVGDLNAKRTEEPYLLISESGRLVDAHAKADLKYENNGSFNSFKVSTGPDVIDHIFTTPNIKVRKWGILTDTYYGKYPSDHFPVESVIMLP